MAAAAPPPAAPRARAAAAPRRPSQQLPCKPQLPQLPAAAAPSSPPPWAPEPMGVMMTNCTSNSVATFAAGAAVGAVAAALCASRTGAVAAAAATEQHEPSEPPASVWRAHPPMGGELWRTSSLSGGSLPEIMDCEPEPLCAGRAAADPDNFWSSRAHRAALLAAAPTCRARVSGNGLVRFELDGQPLTQRGFLRLFAEEGPDQTPRLVPGGDVQRTRSDWAPAVAAARAFRAAVLQCCGDGSGGVYWKGPGFSISSMDDEFIAVCCGTASPLSSHGDGAKFTVNPSTGTEKTEFVHMHPIRIGPAAKPVRVPGSNGFCKFRSPSSTLIVPGRTRKHRCAAPVPAVGVWGGLRNCDGMAHLAVAMQARNARVSGDDDDDGGGGGSLVRDEHSEYLITDEELAMGLRLVAQEILLQLYGTSGTDGTMDAGAEAMRRVWWCTHGHDIPWLHFKVMRTAALLAKAGKGALKEQYSEEHLRLLGFGPDAQPLEQSSR
jgi:hypothetical protein